LSSAADPEDPGRAGTPGVELGLGLDPLGDDTGPHLAGEGGHGPHQGPPVLVGVEVPDQFAVELQEVRGELDHVPEARVAGAGVVDGHPHPPGQPRGQVVPEQGVVGHRLLLGELDHQPVGKGVEQGQGRRVGQQGRAEIDEEEAPLGDGAQP
jgi:hypothetical protein